MFSTDNRAHVTVHKCLIVGGKEQWVAVVSVHDFLEVLYGAPGYLEIGSTYPAAFEQVSVEGAVQISTTLTGLSGR